MSAHARARECVINGTRLRWCNKHQGFWPLKNFRRDRNCSRGFANECKPCRAGRRAVEKERRASAMAEHLARVAL